MNRPRYPLFIHTGLGTLSSRKNMANQSKTGQNPDHSNSLNSTEAIKHMEKSSLSLF